MPTVEENRKARAKFRDYLLRRWPYRARYRAAIHFALVMLENEDSATGEIRVSMAKLAEQYACTVRNAEKHVDEVVKDLQLFEICGKFWSQSQRERRRVGRPASPCNVYRRNDPSEFSVDIDSRNRQSKKTDTPSKDIVPGTDNVPGTDIDPREFRVDIDGNPPRAGQENSSFDDSTFDDSTTDVSASADVSRTTAEVVSSAFDDSGTGTACGHEHRPSQRCPADHYKAEPGRAPASPGRVDFLPDMPGVPVCYYCHDPRCKIMLDAKREARHAVMKIPDRREIYVRKSTGCDNSTGTDNPYS